MSLRSSEADEQNSEFTLKHQTLPDGRVKTTATGFPGKEWFGANIVEATRKATRGLQEAQAAGEQDNAPAWMTNGSMSGKRIS